MQGKAVMKALNPKERLFKGLRVFVNDPFDPFENGHIAITPRLMTCMSYHGKSGIRSVGTVSRSVDVRRTLVMKEANPVEIGRASSRRRNIQSDSTGPGQSRDQKFRIATI